MSFQLAGITSCRYSDRWIAIRGDEPCLALHYNDGPLCLRKCLGSGMGENSRSSSANSLMALISSSERPSHGIKSVCSLTALPSISSFLSSVSCSTEVDPKKRTGPPQLSEEEHEKIKASNKM